MTENPFEDDPLLTVAQVANIFSVTKATVRLWLNSEVLKGQKISSNQWRVRRSACTEFANKKYGE